MSEENIVILGAGMTGLSCGAASGFPVYEASEKPGGICSSYYMKPGTDERLPASPSDDAAYRFEIGGGHWIFGGEPAVHQLIRNFSPVKRYARKSSVYLPDKKLRIPYPLQNHLGYLGSEMAGEALSEMIASSENGKAQTTMAEWLRSSFGPTLCDLFFDPFHELYTAGLWKRIAPQDGYKTPFDLRAVKEGAERAAAPVGYNATFVYPEQGLNVLALGLASQSDVRFGMKAVKIEADQKIVHFENGNQAHYETLISTLPLNFMMKITGLTVLEPPFPSPSVLVVNVGARKGLKCPDDHWIYFSKSKSGFHRVGFYSNVDPSFLPKKSRKSENAVGIYVEKAYPEGSKPDSKTIDALCQSIVAELKALEWISETEVVDPTWIETAYTWSWPGSRWKEKAIAALESKDIHQVGRYGRWIFQGIADSIRDGLLLGAAFKSSSKCASLTY